MSYSSDPPDDVAIIRAILAGNIDLFQVMLDRYQGHVAGIVRRHVPRDEVSEVAHEVFVRAYQSLKGYRGIKPFKHWLSKIAVRCCYDYWRGYHQRREDCVCPLTDDCRDWVENFFADPSREEELERLEARELLHWALGQLSPADRTVLTLTYLDEHSTKEASKLLDWSVPRVKIQSFRARRKLRNILAKILPLKKGEA